MSNITLIKSCFDGEIYAPVSKSDAHRALICAATTGLPTDITVSEPNADIGATVECLRALGSRVERTERGYRVDGKIRGGGALNCGESGSTLRFLLPIAATTGVETTFYGSGKLPSRPMVALTSELRRNGGTVSADNLPITLSGKIRAGRYELAGNISSQYISGLMMALPMLEGKSEIILTTSLESEGYVDMTVKTLEKFGVRWKKQTGTGYILEDAKYTTPGVYETEGDWSGAAFFAVMGALGGKININGLDVNSLQPDKNICGILKRFGAKVEMKGKTLTVEKSEAHPFNVDVSEYPDLFPVLAVLACGAKGESRLYNASRLRIKESDRIETTAAMIRALGGRVETTEDSMTVYGSGTLEGGTVDGANDHRIVMSACAATAVTKGNITVLGIEAVNKSYARFFDDYEIVRCKL